MIDDAGAFCFLGGEIMEEKMNREVEAVVCQLGKMLLLCDQDPGYLEQAWLCLAEFSPDYML
ncbi:hypothetical protein SDC9_140793 [bioreactor metagenome]|uniref:Uncharacterized protein n=1 Tax=bioreactor metagenome TaxID=1076179 RepID=A0A645DYI4_9ZZZZ